MFAVGAVGAYVVHRVYGISGTSGCIGYVMCCDRRRRIWHVGFMARRARYVAMSSPTAVYSRVVRSSLVVMNVVWFCTARVYIAAVGVFQCRRVTIVTVFQCWILYIVMTQAPRCVVWFFCLFMCCC